MNVSRVKKDGSKTIFCTEQEFEDLLSAMGMAIREADKTAKDSPQFRKALHKINRQLWKANIRVNEHG